MSKTEMQILDLCRKERIDIHKFNDIYKLSQNAPMLPSIFEICHIYIDNKDYQKTILKILNENMNEFEKWIEANKINQFNFVIYADSHSHLLVASVNTFSYDASIIYRATLHFSSFIEYLPEEINNVGHRNVIKIVKKMCKESKNVLQQSLVDACRDRNNNEYFALLEVLLGVGTSQKYRYYPSEFVRIEFLKTCKTLKQIQAFMKINQFIENVSMRLEYTVHFADVLKRNRKECEQLAGIISIVFKMCNSDVKIRRELGVRFLEVLTKLNLTTDVSAYKKLAFDSYQEIRDIASKYVLLDFDRDFLHNKITSHEYSDIYASAEIILRKNDHQYYIDILQNTIRDENISDAIEKNVYGMIVLANQCKTKIEQIDLIYKHCFDQCLKVFSNVQNGIESDEEPIAITVLWRTLKETIHYYIIHLDFASCLQVITDVMLSINHLGLISYVFELFRARLRKESSFTDQKIKDTLEIIIDRILMNRYNLSRKGAGIALLFTAFAYNETNKTIVLEMLFKHQDQFEHGIDTHVIYTNILTRLAKLDDNDQCALFTYAFRCLGHKEWKVKNAGTMLFANLMYKLFGNKAFDHNSKRYIFQDIREIIYENRNKAKYLVLCFYNRMKYLTEREIEFVAECKDLGGYFKLKTNKILHKEKHRPMNIENKQQEPIKKSNDLCIRLFADLNNEDLNIRNEAMTIAKEIGFEDASNEYLKHLIVEDSVENNYFDRLKASIKKCERIETKSDVYKSENNNDFYDFDYLCELFNKDI